MGSILKDIFKKGSIIYQDVFIDAGFLCTGETLVKTYIIKYNNDLYFIKKVDDQTEVFIPLANEGKIIVWRFGYEPEELKVILNHIDDKKMIGRI